MNVQTVLIDVGKSVAGVVVAKNLKLADKFDFGDSLLMRNASNGALYFLVSDAINYATNGTSKIMNMNVVGALDDIGFLTATSTVADVSGTDTQLLNAVQQNLGLSRQNAEILSESSIISGSRFLADYIDSQADLPSFLQIVRRPASYVVSMKN